MIPDLRPFEVIKAYWDAMLTIEEDAEWFEPEYWEVNS